jgi:hypothetical protein
MPPRKPAQAASLERIERALESEDPNVRVSAIQHAAALGVKGRPLAARIARAIDDPSGAVAWHVPRAFRAVGAGAVDALEVLLPMLDGKGDQTRTIRALFCIGAIGPAARPALPSLLALAKRKDVGAAALEGIAGLAGESSDEALLEPMLAALFSSDYGRSSAVARAIAVGPKWLGAAALDAFDARLGPETNGAVLLADLAERSPARAVPSIERALEAGGTTARMALLAVERLPGPLTDSIVRTVLTRAGEGDEGAGRTLQKIGAAIRAEVSPDAIDRIANAIERSKELRAIGALGHGLAEIAPGSGAAMHALLARFGTGPETKSVLGSWYSFGDIARALGKLADDATSEEAASALTAALERSDSQVRGTDESSALDLQRAIKEGLAALAPRSEAAARSAKKKVVVDAVDAEHASRDRTAPKLAPIPKARPRRPPPVIRAVTAAERKTLREAIARGREIAASFARITTRSSPDAIASAVDLTVRAMRRSKKKPAPRAAGDLASLYADSLVRGQKWRWRVWSDGAHVSFAVVSPKDAHAVLPVQLVLRQLKPGVEITLLLLFRMIRGGNVPTPRPGTPQLLQ